MALASGTRLGPYEITAQIGVGGMGKVYRATDTNLKRPVAIKVLPDSVATDRERLARFQREAEVLAALNHPNIAHIHGLEKSSGQVALVMELVEGPTLADRIAQGPIPVHDALPIAKQIADALEAAHDQGIIHRDLKPANIKVRDDGTVKVLDFGLAKALGPEGGSAAGGSASVSMSPTITSPAMTQMGMMDAVGDFAPVWSPDGSQVIYASERDGVWGFYRRSADGVGVEELLAEVEGADRLAPGNWSPDGRSLVFMMTTNETSRDVGVLSLDGDPTWRPLLHSEADEAHPVISPDGHWLAYSSDEGGIQEVYLQRFPDLGDRRKVSSNGGFDPAWAPDGRKLYYIRSVGNGPPVAMSAVSVDPSPPLSIGTPEVLFSHAPYRRPPRTPRWYDVRPAGDGFVMVASADTAGGDAPLPQVITVQSWFEELKRLVPRN